MAEPRYRIRGQEGPFGTPDLIPDPFRPTGWFVTVDLVGQSYVDLADPTYLRFPNQIHISRIIDLHWPQREPISAVHVGGAGCTVPRYVAATRPDSRQTVFDIDEQVINLARQHLDLDGVPGLDVRIQDGRAGVRDTASETVDLVVLDVFHGQNMVTELATVEFFGEISQVLRARGVFLTNVSSTDGLGFPRRVVATTQEIYPHVLAIGEADVVLGRERGNLIVAASHQPLPLHELMAQAEAPDSGFACMSGERLLAMHGSASPMSEDEIRG